MSSFWRHPAAPLACVLSVKLALSAAVLAHGFHAISDDDFARVFIAQQFAETPSFDPSKTSWLPLPFWLTGAALSLFGSGFEAARGVAIILGLIAAALLYLSARWLKCSPWVAALGALIGSAIPYSAYLGVATVPESLSAALIVAACASTIRTDLFSRFAGAAFASAACLCRYEAWPIALGVAGLALYDFSVRRSTGQQLSLPRPLFGAGVALTSLSGAGSWLLSGWLTHGSATFFVSRVAEYRRAIGASPEALSARLFGYPLGFLRGEPELVLAASILLVWVLVHHLGRSRQVFWGWFRPGALLLLMLVSLIYGDLRDGAPTHHSERAILALWLFSGLWVAHAAAHCFAAQRSRLLAGLLLVSTLLGAFILRPWYARRDSFIDRRAALEIGEAAKQRGVQRLAVAAPDFGFYAVFVGYGSPSSVHTLDPHDPRSPAPIKPLSSIGALKQSFEASHASALILPQAALALSQGWAQVEAENHAWALVTPIDRKVSPSPEN